MEKLIGKYHIGNGKVKPVNEFSNLSLNTNLVVYEVIRVISGIPLFVEEHLERLRFSMIRTGWEFLPDFKKISFDIIKLIRQNKVATGNIKLTVVLNEGKLNTCIFLIPHLYPSENDYRSGVEVGILHAERRNPEAKTSQVNVRDKANEIINKNNFYEVLLVDDKGFIREGSRSNVFFIKDEIIVTPPESIVLNGITRQKVIQILKNNSFSFSEEQVSVKKLETFDSIFLTGTSPKILSVNQIESFVFNINNKICNRISEEYDRLIVSYISKKNKQIS